MKNHIIKCYWFPLITMQYMYDNFAVGYHINRRFGNKCQGCNLGILPEEKVYHLGGSHYHVNCFICGICSKQFKTGDKYHLSDQGKPICKEDFDVAILCSDGRSTVKLILV